MIFQMNAVFGNLTTAVLLKRFSVPVTTLLWIMSVVALIGSVAISAVAVLSKVNVKPAKEEEAKYSIIHDKDLI